MKPALSMLEGVLQGHSAIIAKMEESAKHVATAVARVNEAADLQELTATMRRINKVASELVTATEIILKHTASVRSKVSRSECYKALTELLPKPSEKSLKEWHDVYDDLYLHDYALLQGREAWTENDQQWAKHDKVIPLDSYLRSGGNSILDSLLKHDWPRADACVVAAFGLSKAAISWGLRRRSERHAVATYKLAAAIAGRVQQTAGGKLPPKMYRNLTGILGLVTSDPRWSDLLVPDATGFRGVLSSGQVNCNCARQYFQPGGFAPGGPAEDKAVDSDVVCFESAEKDSEGLHAPAMLTNDKGLFPPNSLFVVQHVSQGKEFEMDGVKVHQRLITVRATFRLPGDHAAGDAGGKMCSRPFTLEYKGRAAFACGGLDDVLEQPFFTIYEEFDRDFSWTDYNGKQYNLKDEMAYVMGAAERKEGCTPGVRDDGENHGKEPTWFMERANAHIAARRMERWGLHIPVEKALLVTEEVLGIRLYSGPAYQPLNEYLREIGKMGSNYRLSVSRKRCMTFAATVGHIMAGIRKLAAVVTDDEVKEPLYRGVRGALPEEFWLPDEGMVCATDTALMSTSRHKLTPIHYMGDDGDNVLWELKVGKETNIGMHFGADISMLSQFGKEREVLFPPYTMLEVLMDESNHDYKPGLKVKRDHADGKSFVSIGVMPTFS